MERTTRAHLDHSVLRINKTLNRPEEPHTKQGFRYLYKQASEYGMRLIIQDACRIMQKHQKYHEFVMAMGSIFFIDPSSNIIHNPAKFTHPLLNFISDYDEEMHFTGAGIRFKKDGKITTNW